MEYDANTHSLQCPKCKHGMDEVTYGNLTIDRCTECQGIWFDSGEAEALKDRWMGEALDTGDPDIGKKWNEAASGNAGFRLDAGQFGQGREDVQQRNVPVACSPGG